MKEKKKKVMKNKKEKQIYTNKDFFIEIVFASIMSVGILFGLYLLIKYNGGS